MANPTETPLWRRDHGTYPGWQIALSFFLGCVFLIAGVVGLIALPFSIARTHRFIAEAVHVQAPIVGFEAEAPDRSHATTSYRPIVGITDRQGRVVRVLVGEGDYADQSAIGQKLDVMYVPGHEADAVSDTSDALWGDTIAIGVLGGALLLSAIGILLWMRYFVRFGPEQLTWLDRWGGPLKLGSWLLLR